MSLVASVESQASAVVSPVPVGYFQKSLPINLILGTFFAVTLPLAAFIWFNNSQMLLWGYLWLFGMTHFVLTFTVYLNRGNLAHFGRTWRNRLVYFALPVVIFVGFDLLHVFHMREIFPIFTLYFFAAVRLVDFNHFNRQSFGVLQMFKAAAGERYAKRLKHLENLHFKLGTVLMVSTFLAGGVFPLLQEGGPLTLANLGWRLMDPILPIPLLQVASTVLILAYLGLLSYLVVALRRTRTAVDALWVDKPAARIYLFNPRGIAADDRVSDMAAALAIHYVEYHVLMYPLRHFHCPLDARSRLDRFFARLRAFEQPLCCGAAVGVGIGDHLLFHRDGPDGHDDNGSCRNRLPTCC